MRPDSWLFLSEHSLTQPDSKRFPWEFPVRPDSWLFLSEHFLILPDSKRFPWEFPVRLDSRQVLSEHFPLQPDLKQSLSACCRSVFPHCAHPSVHSVSLALFFHLLPQHCEIRPRIHLRAAGVPPVQLPDSVRFLFACCLQVFGPVPVPAVHFLPACQTHFPMPNCPNSGGNIPAASASLLLPDSAPFPGMVCAQPQFPASHRPCFLPPQIYHAEQSCPGHSPFCFPLSSCLHLPKDSVRCHVVFFQMFRSDNHSCFCLLLNMSRSLVFGHCSISGAHI